MAGSVASKLAPTTMRRQRGFSLVELMVSLLIGIILVYGAVRLLVDSRNTQRASESTASVQEIATYALAVLEPDVRLASYWGRTWWRASRRPLRRVRRSTPW
jgi:type IV pilus assembly protein PilW